MIDAIGEGGGPTAPAPWQPITDVRSLKCLGKLGEELGKLLAIKDRVLIQGLDGLDPRTGAPNRLRFEEELADVLSMIGLTMKTFGLNEDEIMTRMGVKAKFTARWIDMK